MATYYVDYVNGLDANNGLGPDASHATNKPWKTLAKLLGAAGMASGDTAYLSPAGPFREVVTVAMTSATAETKVIGDPQNAQGFKTSGAVLVSPGPIIWTAYTTNDKTAPSASATLNLDGRDYLTFQNIMFVNGTTASTITASTATSTNITFTDCAFVAGHQTAAGHIACTIAYSVNAAWLIDRCYFGPTRKNEPNVFTLGTGTGADYDCGVVIRDSLFVNCGANQCVIIRNTATNANRGGGLIIRNCSLIGAMAQAALQTVATYTSTTIPCQILNSFVQASAAVNAGTSGQITENYNLFACPSPRTNVTAGANSISDGSYAPLYHFGQERIWKSPLFKHFGEPLQGSPLLGFGNDGSQAATDFLALQRPAGGASALPAAGALERHNNWTTDSTAIGTGSSPITITGPGDQAFLIPVPASAVTISVVVKWDATYAGTKPQLQLDANAELGVSTQTVTATGSSGANETLTLSAFTPSKAGRMVTVRVKSNDTNGAGVVEADNFTVTA